MYRNPTRISILTNGGTPLDWVRLFRGLAAEVGFVLRTSHRGRMSYPKTPRTWAEFVGWVECNEAHHDRYRSWWALLHSTRPTFALSFCFDHVNSLDWVRLGEGPLLLSWLRLSTLDLPANCWVRLGESSKDRTTASPELLRGRPINKMRGSRRTKIRRGRDHVAA